MVRVSYRLEAIRDHASSREIDGIWGVPGGGHGMGVKGSPLHTQSKGYFYKVSYEREQSIRLSSW